MQDVACIHTWHILLSVTKCKMLHVYRPYFTKCDSMQDVACIHCIFY